MNDWGIFAICLWLCLSVLTIGIGLFLIMLLPSRKTFQNVKRVINVETGKTIHQCYRFPFGDNILQEIKDYEGHWRKQMIIKGKEQAVGWWGLNVFFVVFLESSAIKQFLTASETLYTRTMTAFPVTAKLFGSGILAASGDEWSKHHKILMKAFSTKNVMAFVPIMVNETKKVALQLRQAAKCQSPLDMSLIFTDLAVSIVFETLFGDSVSEEDAKIIADTFQIIKEESANILFQLPLLRNLPFPAKYRLDTQFQILYDAIDRVVRRRRKCLAQAQHSQESQIYAIDLFLSENADGSYFTDVEVRSNLINLLIAGTETTASTMTWIIWHVSQHEQVKEALLSELDSVGANDENFTPETPNEFTYLKKVIDETLRFTHPISGLPPRIPLQDMTIGNWFVPAGVPISANFFALHRLPEYFENPDTFDPLRWDSIDKNELNFSFIPFGAGKRSCIGKLFAYIEMKTVLSLLFREFNFKYNQANGPVNQTYKVPFIQPKNGLSMFVTTR